MLPKIVEDLAAFNSRCMLFPVEACLGKTKNIDIVRVEILAEISEINEVITSADSIWVLEVDT